MLLIIVQISLELFETNGYLSTNGKGYFVKLL